MNPVATEAMGLGKRQRAIERQGLRGAATREERERRLRKLREYEWSSYGAYGGYAKSPDWLERGALLRRAGKEGETSYRALVEERIRHGQDEGLGAKLRWGLVLGAERFAEKVRGRIRVQREHQDQGLLRRRRGFEEIVRTVERIKGEKWEGFRDRYGDWGRDVVLWAGRRYGDLRLGELGAKAGGMDYTAVAMGVRRVELRSQRDRVLSSAMKRVAKECEM